MTDPRRSLQRDRLLVVICQIVVQHLQQLDVPVVSHRALPLYGIYAGEPCQPHQQLIRGRTQRKPFQRRILRQCMLPDQHLHAFVYGRIFRLSGRQHGIGSFHGRKVKKGTQDLE